jgi:hypothetical protein
MKKVYVFLLKGIFISGVCFAQHDMHRMHDHPDSTTQKTDSIMHMNHSFSRNLPMSRDGSGTAWMPDASVMYGHGIHLKSWMLMFHGNIFIRYNNQDITNKGQRGDDQIDAPAWIMLMGQKNISKRGLFHFSVMPSLDPFTVGNKGYPLLFQSGETYKGKRLVDRQHPHDLFSELSVAYTHMISQDLDLTAYLAYPGEPAIGTVAFMHRTSALNNPDAPLSHHWQDATHISFGVATLGLRYKIVKLEGSCFTGREPDENRYNFDQPRFDSYSVRLLCNPSEQLALQVSQAYLKSPELSEPGEDLIRTTASVIHHLSLGGEHKYLATTFAWGLNKSHHEEHSFLLEPNLQLDKTALYLRYEWVQKSADELDLPQFNNGHKAIFTIQSFTLGINRVLVRAGGNNIAAGIQGSIYHADSRLNYLYGENPLAAEVYIRLYPHLMHMHSHTMR